MINKVLTKVRGGIYGVTLRQKIRSCGINSPTNKGAKGWLGIIPRLVRLKFKLSYRTRFVIRLMLLATYKENIICWKRYKC